MEKVKLLLAELFSVPWKRRFYGGLMMVLGLVIFISLYDPYSMEGESGVKIIFCPFRNMTGLPCPGCGMTRAVHHIARGEFSEALSLHLFSPVFYVALLVELVNSITAIARKGRPLFYWGELFDHRIIKYPTYAFFGAMVTYNFYRIWLLFHTSPTFSDAVSDSIIYRIFSAVGRLLAG